MTVAPGRPDVSVDDLAEEIAATLGEPSVRLAAVSGGASRGAFGVFGGTDIGADAEPLAFLRVDEGNGALSGTELSLAREGGLLRALASTGLPLPKILAEFTDPPALLMNMVRGQARVGREQAPVVGPKYMALLAEIHRLDPATVLERPETDGPLAVRRDLDWWRQLSVANRADECPLVATGYEVLNRNVPEVESRAVMLHGDAGAGNFMHEAGEVTALLDWEMAHAGDWHEDLAWVGVRTVFTPFGVLGERLAEYEAASGRTIEVATLYWFEALGVWKSLAATEAKLRTAAVGPTVLMQQMITLTYQVVLAELLLKVLGEAPLAPVTAVALDDNAESNLAGQLLTEKQKLSSDGVAIVEHLRRAARMRAGLERAGADDFARSKLPPTPPPDESRDALTERVRILGHAAERAAQADARAPLALARARREGGLLA